MNKFWRRGVGFLLVGLIFSTSAAAQSSSDINIKISSSGSSDDRNASNDQQRNRAVGVERGTLVTPAGSMVMVSAVPVNEGQSLDFFVQHNVLNDDGVIVIPQGAEVKADWKWRRTRRIGKPGFLRIKLKSTVDVNGMTVPLSGSYETKGKSRRGKAVGLTIGMSFLYPPLSVLHLLHRGGSVELSTVTIRAFSH